MIKHIGDVRGVDDIDDKAGVDDINDKTGFDDIDDKTGVDIDDKTGDDDINDKTLFTRVAIMTEMTMMMTLMTGFSSQEKHEKIDNDNVRG